MYQNPTYTGQPAGNQGQFQNTLQSPGGLYPQQTGYGAPYMQSQATGLPAAGQQAMSQGFQPQPQQQQQPYPASSQGPGRQPTFQQPEQQFAPAPQQPYPTGQPMHNASMLSGQPTGMPGAALAAQPTGMGGRQTSSDIAQSFQKLDGSSRAPASNPQQAAAKIPLDRLSFLTLEDQVKFTKLFKSAVGDGQALDGDKARDLLLRSKLPGRDLMQIWVLSDTTKSGQLLFPEFALAMYLCNLKIVGKDLPQTLPERIRNEVSDMVDKISFGVPDDRPEPSTRSNVPNFEGSSRPSAENPNMRQPQPQASNAQLLNQLTAQPTGFAAQYIPPQPTGLAPQQTGFGPTMPQFQTPGSTLQQQQQQMRQPQQFSSAPTQSMTVPGGMPSALGNQMAGFQGNNQGQAMNTGPAFPLNAQPTGRPGQWGLVNAPASGLPNIDALRQRLMPQTGREGSFSTAGLSGNATVPWAVTKEEKRIYDDLFKAWDGLGKGFISGNTAIELMGQSGLGKPDLEKIWTLSDPGNKGRLDMDEFAVAMHLIYRKLNGYPVPNQLPPELIPPSTRNFSDSIGTVKNLLTRDADTRKTSGAFLEPQKTGVSYLKNHSFRNDGSGSTGRKDATVYRNDDDDIGYKSSARRRLGGAGRTPSPVQSTQSSSSGGDLSIEQLRKAVREKQIQIDAMDFQDENEAEQSASLDRRDRDEVEDLYRRIRHIQDDINRHPDASLRTLDAGTERKAMKRQLQALTDRLPQLASGLRTTERNIFEAQLELFRLQDAKAHPDQGATLVGTGPGGSITDSDRRTARAKTLMQQRTAALTGKPVNVDADSASSAAQRLEEHNLKVRKEKDDNERLIRDVEDSVRDFAGGLEDNLRANSGTAASEHERDRWESGIGVEDDVKSFIFELQRSSESSKKHTASLQNRNEKGSSLSPQQSEPNSSLGSARSTSQSQSRAMPRTAEEREAYIREQAEQRIAGRLAALRPKTASTTVDPAKERQEREAKERQERLRQAEAEDRRRDEERQRRLAAEQTQPPPSKTVGKKPPPPPSRGSRVGSMNKSQAPTSRPSGADSSVTSAETTSTQAAELKREQEAQAVQTKALEDQALQQEAELARQREATEARMKALEEQYQAGKLKKQEEKKRKQAAQQQAKESEARLASQRAELDAARERERQLQLQLESLEDASSDDDDGPAEATPRRASPALPPPSDTQASVSTSTSVGDHAVTKPVESSPNGAATASLSRSPPTAASGGTNETRNPFFRGRSQTAESAQASSDPKRLSITSPAASESTNNPFHRLTQQENAQKAASGGGSASMDRPTRSRPEEDEWSAVGSTTDSSDDDDDDQPTGGSAKQLASILFGTMGPPRPVSAMDDRKSSIPHTPSTPVPGRAPNGTSMSIHEHGESLSPDALQAPNSAPPPPPPMPGTTETSSAPAAPPPPPPLPDAAAAASPPIMNGAPAAPPPPPPPPPSGGAAAANATAAPTERPGIGALLGAIQKGTGLKKVETKDRSQASVAGRVL